MDIGKAASSFHHISLTKKLFLRKFLHIRYVCCVVLAWGIFIYVVNLYLHCIMVRKWSYRSSLWLPLVRTAVLRGSVPSWGTKICKLRGAAKKKKKWSNYYFFLFKCIEISFVGKYIDNFCQCLTGAGCGFYFKQWHLQSIGFPGGTNGKEPTCQCNISI